MTFSDSTNDWVDGELRRVPLPAGLLARLRAIVIGRDEELDAALRDVTVPPTLLEALNGIVTYEDAHMDAELNDVQLPDEMLSKLGTIPVYAGEHLHAALRDLPLPADLLERLEAIPSTDRHAALPERRRRQRSSWWQMAAAASLLFVISFSYLTAIAAFVSTAYQEPPQDVLVVMIEKDPVWIDMQRDEFVDVALVEFEQQPVEPLVEPAVAPAVTIAWAGDDPERIFDSQLLAQGPYGDALRRFDNASVETSLISEVFELRYPPLAAPRTDNSEPLTMVTDIRPRGLPPSSAVSPNQLLFHLRYNAHPLLDPAADKRLRTAVVPLGSTSAGFHRAWDSILQSSGGPDGRKQLEAHLAESVRTEDFLQAIAYPVPPPTSGPLALRVYGGPSPFAQPGTRLLHVVARASDSATANQSARHLTVLVDTSASPQRSTQLRSVRQALHHFVDKLGPDDRLSLVACSDSANLLIDRAGYQDRGALRAAIELLRPARGTNIAEAIRFGASLVQATEFDTKDAAHSMLLLSGKSELMTGRTIAQVESILVELSDRHVRFGIVAMSGLPEQDSQLARFATAGGGRVAAGGETEELIWSLQEARTGTSQVIANKARLTVHFNPEAVAEYRLMGHKATSTVGVVAAPVEVDFHAGQTCAGLFEVRLHQRGPNEIGWAELTWQDSATGRMQRLRQRISRLQFAPTFTQSAMPLQAATLAAETAELLRRSPFAVRPASSLVAVRDFAELVDSPLGADASFHQFVEFLNAAQRAGLR